MSYQQNFYYRTKNSMNNIYELPSNLFSREKELPENFEKYRIIQKNLVYIIGLSKNLIEKGNALCNFEYFGQYGTISKFVINKNKIYNENGQNGPSYSCYITYSCPEESSLAILTLDNSIIDGHVIKASFGTTKYCTNFLKNSVCLNKECIYLHELASEKDICLRSEMSANKNFFNNHQSIALERSKILTSQEVKNKIDIIKNYVTVFPNAYTVYNKKIVKDNMKSYRKNSYPFTARSKNSSRCLGNISNLFIDKKQSRFDFVLKDQDRFENGDGRIEVPVNVRKFISNELLNYNLYKDKKLSKDYFSLFGAQNGNSDWDLLINLYKNL